jgi:hypothetical protein
VRVYHKGLPAEKISSIIVTKGKTMTFVTTIALVSLFILLAQSLSTLLPPPLEGALAQIPPEDCNKCIVIEYEGEHTAIIGGVESFANTTTQQEQYNSYLWRFIDSLVSDGFEIKSVMMEYDNAEDDSTEDIYHVVLRMP